MKEKIKWMDQPEEHDYPAAFSYLTLIHTEYNTKRNIEDLRNANITFFKAKDIFRASGLALLSEENSHVKKDIEKIKNGKEIPPLILLRDPSLGKVIIADGYHRLCAVYHFDEDSLIPCKIK